MLKKLSSILIGIICIGILASSGAQGQVEESLRIKLENVLYKFRNYRYSTISIYRIKDIKDIRDAIKAKDKEANEQSMAGSSECVKKADPNLIISIKSAIDKGSGATAVKMDLAAKGDAIPDDFDCIFDAISKGDVQDRPYKNAYVITTRMAMDQIEPSTIIALIITKEDDDMQKNINIVSAKDIYTNPEMFQFTLDTKEFRANNMHELVMNAFRQGNVANMTLEAQGIGTFVKYIDKKYGTSQSLVANESDVSPYDVQSFMRISEGQPFDYKEVNNEVVVSPDLLSWKRYDVSTISYSDGYVDTVSTVVNRNLPQYGFELKYGIDEINYPGLWSERMTASALWENMKLGIILPTAGWASMSKDVFDVDRKLTYAGVGVAAKADFPVKVIPQSGVFSLAVGYVFGDAEVSDFHNSVFDEVNNLSYSREYDYLIRGNGSLHYTFGISIDDSYWLRFGVGATVYSVETWENRVVSGDADKDAYVEHVKKAGGSETVGGLSGRFEFMSKDIATPYGATVQYFDESIYTNVWLQIPIVKNTLALRLDAKGYFTAFKDNPRLWENESVFMPMARLIVTF